MRNWFLCHTKRHRSPIAETWDPDYIQLRAQAPTRHTWVPDSEELIYHIVQGFGNHHGSLPAESVQTSMRRDHPLLYNTIVRDNHQGRWHVFLALAPPTEDRGASTPNTCSDVLCLFQTEKEQTWRIHLRRDDLKYEAVDKVMEVLRTEAEAALCARMKDHLLQCPMQSCTLREIFRHPNDNNNKKKKRGVCIRCPPSWPRTRWNGASSPAVSIAPDPPFVPCV